jgi:hypothetical protein
MMQMMAGDANMRSGYLAFDVSFAQPLLTYLYPGGHMHAKLLRVLIQMLLPMQASG